MIQNQRCQNPKRLAVACTREDEVGKRCIEPMRSGSDVSGNAQWACSGDLEVESSSQWAYSA